jgi:hypothetical protein
MSNPSSESGVGDESISCTDLVERVVVIQPGTTKGSNPNSAIV